MSRSTLGVDLYQLTTLIAHAQEQRLEQQVAMSFFFRKMPKNRNYVVACGLRSILAACAELRFSKEELATIENHPVLAPVFLSEAGKASYKALETLDGFVGEIDALPEGTLAFAGPAYRANGEAIVLPGGTPLIAYTPLAQVRTSLPFAKLIETPWLSRLNYLSMVASKAARIVRAAKKPRGMTGNKERSVIEFGQRRTHPEAAVDAAYAAYLAGCQATSNVLSTHVYGIPSVGTMDHFAVQASEQLGLPVSQTEIGFFRTFCELFPHAATLLVDTYDTLAGVRGAVFATKGSLSAVRLDSNVTEELIGKARALLAELSAPSVQIFVSDGLDEWRVASLPSADGFGVGENITCSPDAATGIGAVGKLVENGYGKPTMKLSRGSGKATLPGVLQVYRREDHDYLALAAEPAPKDGRPLLVPVWRGKQALPLPTLEESRTLVQRQIASLPEPLQELGTDHGKPWRIVLSEPLYQMVNELSSASVAHEASS